MNHILFTCPYARLIWAVSPIQAPPSGEMSDSLYANIYRVLNLKHHSPHLKIYDDLVPWLLWRIWKNRNEFIFKGIDYSAPSSISKATEDMEEWKRRQEEEHTMTRSPPISNTRAKWKAPPPQWIKCNTDGAWRKDHHRSGVGWIARNNIVQMLWAGAKNLQRMNSPIETEAEGIKWAMQSLCSLGYKQVIFETDSQILARMVVGKESTWPKLKPILQEIQHILSGNLGLKVTFFPREGNKAADRVANEAFSLENHVPKLHSILPIWLKSVCEADMSVVNMNSVGE